MKPFFVLFLSILFSGWVFTSCKDDNVTFAEELAAEQDLISDFIKRQGIKVVTSMPTNWSDTKVYYKSPTGLYFRLNEAGDSTTQAASGDLIVPRYIQYTLNVKPDTISHLSTIDFELPYKFNYLDYTQVCKGWHEAVTYMKNHNSAASIIVFSRIGFSQYGRPATPIGYDLKIKIQKNY